MHADNYERRFLPSMTFRARTNSRAAVPGGALLGKFLLALLLNLMAAHSAWAECSFNFVTGFGTYTPTKAISGSAAPAGTVVYDETWMDNVTITCPTTDTRSDNRISSNRRIYALPVQGGNVYGGTLRFDSEIGLSEATGSGTATSSSGKNFIFFEFPLGVTRSTMRVRLLYKKTDDAAIGAGFWSPSVSAGNERRIFASVQTFSEEVGSTRTPILLNLSTGGVRSYGSTCNLTVPLAVTLRAVPQRLFTGIGTVPAERTNFNISADCSGVVAGQVVGVSFSASSQDASGSPGVIATTQGDGKAAGVGLQIVNTTSGRPVAFNALEQGIPPPRLNGTYNFPMRVQYFQTAATVGAGTVTGTTVVTMQYR